MKERHAWWARVLVLGLVLFAINVPSFAYTHNNVLLAPILILGSFLVPVTCVIATLEWLRRGQSGRWVWNSAESWVPSAWLGWSPSSSQPLIETQAVEHGPGWYFLLVAITEEGLKLAVLWLVARGLGTFNRRQGWFSVRSLALGSQLSRPLGRHSMCCCRGAARPSTWFRCWRRCCCAECSRLSVTASGRRCWGCSLRGGRKDGQVAHHVVRRRLVRRGGPAAHGLGCGRQFRGDLDRRGRRYRTQWKTFTEAQIPTRRWGNSVG